MGRLTLFFSFFSGGLGQCQKYMSLKLGLTSGAYFLLISSLGGKRELTGRRIYYSDD